METAPNQSPDRRAHDAPSGWRRAVRSGPRALLLWAFVFVVVGTSYAATLGLGLWLGARFAAGQGVTAALVRVAAALQTPANTAAPGAAPDDAPEAAPTIRVAAAPAATTPAPSPSVTPAISRQRYHSPDDFAREFRSRVGARFAEASANDRDRCLRRALDEAERLLDSAEWQFPDDPVVIGYRGVIDYYREQFDRAEEYLAVACERLKDDAKCQPRRMFEAYRRWASEKRELATNAR